MNHPIQTYQLNILKSKLYILGQICKENDLEFNKIVKEHYPEHNVSIKHKKIIRKGSIINLKTKKKIVRKGFVTNLKQKDRKIIVNKGNAIRNVNKKKIVRKGIIK